jgi:hypothetical protein
MKLLCSALLNLIFVFATLPVFADAIVFVPGSQIKLNGDSSVRKFSSISTSLSLRGTAKALKNPLLAWTPTEVEVALPVNSLKSDSATLDEHMYEKLKADQFSQIKILLTHFMFEKNSVTAVGTLTIAGVTKTIEIKGAAKTDGNTLNVSGNYTLLMSDYGITPPTMMLGTVKTDDKIEIEYSINCLINPNEERK